MLAHYGYVGSLGLTVLFSFVCAHEIIYFILWISLSSQKNRSLLHFTINSLFYLGYLLLTYCKNLQFIDWDILYLNPFILFVFSSLLGFWGLRQQQPLYGKYLPYYPFLVVAYMGLYLVSMATVSFHMVHLNTPAIEVVEDAIIFGHISFGVSFLVYIFNMFKTPIARGLPVWKVVYRERSVQYVRLAGLLFIITLAYVGNYAAYSQIFSGYYNGLGDVYKRKGHAILAHAYYKMGVSHAYNNYKSNAELANYYQNKNMMAQSAFYYEQSNKKHPKVSSYLNLSHVLASDYAYFKSIFSLQKGLEVFADHPVLHNNLGVRFMEKHYVDSAIFHLKEGTKWKEIAEVSRSNLSHLYSGYPALVTSQEVAEGLQAAKSLSHRNNWLVLSLQKDMVVSALPPIVPTLTTAKDRAYLYNHTLSSIKGRASSASELLCVYEEDGGYEESLSFLRALRAYEEGRVNEALRTVDVLQGNMPRSRGYFFFLMGLWTLREHAYEASAVFFERSHQNGYTSCLPHYFLALLQAGASNRLRAFLRDHQDTTHDNLRLWMRHTSSLMARGLGRPGEWPDAFSGAYEAPTIYLALWKDTLSLEAKERLVRFYADDVSQQAVLWLYLAWDFLQKEQYEAAFHCLEKGRALPANPHQQAMERLYANAWFLEKRLGPVPIESPWLRRVNRHLASGDFPADSLVALGKQNAFDEGVVLSIVGALNKRRAHDAAYDVLLDATEIHALSNPLLKAYALQALWVGAPNLWGLRPG